MAIPRASASRGLAGADGATFEDDLSRVSRVHTGEYLHEGTLAGAVFTHNGMDLAGRKLELCLVQCKGGTEPLGDICNFEQQHNLS